MNKKFIALAVAALVSGAANAANIYEDDTSTFGVSGEIDTYLSKFDSKQGTDYDTDLDLWAKIQIDATHKLNDTVSVFGSFEVESGSGYSAWSDNNDAYDMSVDDLYFGASFGDSFGIAAGEVGDFGDSLDAITIDNTNEGVGYMDDYVTSFESKGHTVSAKYDANGLVLIADTYLTQEEGLDNAYGVSASYTIAGFNVGASYQDHGNRDSYNTSSDGDNDVYGFKAGYSADMFSVAAIYAVEQNDGVDADVIGLAGDVKFDAARLYASGFVADQDGSSEDLKAYTVGADYSFSSNLLAFVEYSSEDNRNYVDGNDNDFYIAGMYYMF